MEYAFNMTLVEIEKFRLSKKYAELRRKLQEIEDAKEKGDAV